MASAEMAAMLDELMGKYRNVDPTKRPKEPRWDDDSVCKHFLVGYCPNELFVNTRSDIGPCRKLHEENMREMYKKSSRCGKMGYDEDFLAFLTRLQNDMARKIRKNRDRLELTQPSGDVATMEKERIEEKLIVLSEKINVLIVQAEQLGAEGKVEEAQGVIKMCDDMKEERDQLKRVVEQQQANDQEQKLEVCSICGCFLVVNDAPQRVDEHMSGKLHIGFAKLTDTLEAAARQKDEERKKRLGITDDSSQDKRSSDRERASRDRKDRDNDKDRDRHSHRSSRDNDAKRSSRDRERDSKRSSRDHDRDSKRTSRDRAIRKSREHKESSRERTKKASRDRSRSPGRSRSSRKTSKDRGERSSRHGDERSSRHKEDRPSRKSRDRSKERKEREGSKERKSQEKTVEPTSLEESKEHTSPEMPIDDKSREKSNESMSPENSKERTSPVKSKERTTPEKSKERRSREKSRERRKSKDRKSRDRSNERRSGDKSKDRKDRDRSRERKSDSRKHRRSSRERSKHRDRGSRDRSSERERPSKSTKRDRHRSGSAKEDHSDSESSKPSGPRFKPAFGSTVETAEKMETDQGPSSAPIDASATTDASAPADVGEPPSSIAEDESEKSAITNGHEQEDQAVNNLDFAVENNSPEDQDPSTFNSQSEEPKPKLANENHGTLFEAEKEDASPG